MSIVRVSLDRSGLTALEPGPVKRAVVRALRKAGSTALRDMRSEARKRIRARKRIQPKYIARALTLRRAKGSDIEAMTWAVEVSGEPVPLVAYPYKVVGERSEVTRNRKGRFLVGSGSTGGEGGVQVQVNRGKRTLLKGAFVATLKSGHEGIFRRRGKARLPIDELRGSRPVDALLHAGEADAVGERGGKSFGETFTRVLPLEVGKR